MSSEAASFPDALVNAVDSRVTGSDELGIRGDTSLALVPEDLFAARHRHPELTDESLLRQVQEGDKSALGVLFRRHARSVRNVAYRVLRNEAEADDIVQEVFLFIFRKAALFDAAVGTARSWVFQVAYHRAFDRRRYLISRHFYSVQELDEKALRSASQRYQPMFHEFSIEGVLGRDLAARFHARLTTEQRETIELFFFEGYTLREIAELTGRSLINVRNHYYRGLERLRKYVLPEKMRSK